MRCDLEAILTPAASSFLHELHREFNEQRISLLDQRCAHQFELDHGLVPDFLKSTAPIRNDPNWQAAVTPHDLEKRYVEITGPVERKMMINALNSGADVFMADFEDSLSPTWSNVVEGQANLIEAVRKQLVYDSPEGKAYRLNEKLATLVVRPRGWHLDEKHYEVDGEPISASLFDFGLYLFHNADELKKRGTGPYFYLPKLENHLEARLWNEVFAFSENYLGHPKGTIKATVLIETILAAFEMEEILYELQGYIVGLNAGRWDYIFSIIKKFAAKHDFNFPDRSAITMTAPFMRAYTTLLVQTCHKRKAHAMGGMAAFIPSRKDRDLNEQALAKVRLDKELEVSEGFDGTWVAHPDLVPVARKIFEEKLNGKNDQKKQLRLNEKITAKDLLDFNIAGAKITPAGVVQNVSVGLQYLESWFRGVGAAGINNLMEDAATAEISRAQLWQWAHHGARFTDDQQPIGLDKIKEVILQEADSLRGGKDDPQREWKNAEITLKKLVEEDEFVAFFTTGAYANLRDET